MFLLILSLVSDVDSPELELQVVVNYLMWVLETGPRFSARTSESSLQPFLYFYMRACVCVCYVCICAFMYTHEEARAGC